MSRIGRTPIVIPAGVSVEFETGKVKVTGPMGTLTKEINSNINVRIDGNTLHVEKLDNSDDFKKFHGLYRQIINNMVEGVSKGFEKKLVINGVGYKVTPQGNDLVLNIGFSHPVVVKAVDGITLQCEKTTIIVKGIDKELVGQFAAKIRSLKPVEPYHAYGIYYDGEKIIRKEVNSGKK